MTSTSAEHGADLEQIVRDYDDHGYFLFEEFFSPDEISTLISASQDEFAERDERVVREANTDFVRGVHGSHFNHRVFARLTRLPALLQLAEAILKSRVYVHQFKINAKPAFGGDLWEWHQDFFFWQAEDGMPRSRAINFVIHLDGATEFNGPLLLVPGSHRHVPPTSTTQSVGGWRDTVGAKLKYAIEPAALNDMITELGIVSIKAGPGSLLLFHPSLVHGSANNMSPQDRRIVIISYNSVENSLVDVPNPRPDFMACRDFEPLTPISGGLSS